MALTSVLRLNMTGLAVDPADEARRYATALDMAEYCDANGFAAVSTEEHHGAENGWLPAPLVLAAMVVARTKRVQVNTSALLITLYDPIRLAEDIAVLDLASGGRYSFVAGLGYRDLEYHMMDRSFEARGRAMDETITTLLEAWKGEPFEYRGRTVRVTPIPKSRPHPPFFVGGMSKAAAKRAARFGLPFYPPLDLPEVEAHYHEQLEAFGKRGFVVKPGEGNHMLFVDAQPDAAWEALAPYLLREAREYSRWKQAGVPRPGEEQAETIDDLKRQRRYVIVSPEQCLDEVHSGERQMGVMHPLCGGIPVERAWTLLRTYVDEVVARL